MATHGQQRILIMDIIKLVASFFVVFIHSNFYGSIGVAVKAIARFAVPFFFLCSGYFLYGSSSQKILKKLSHIAQLYFSAVLLYAIFRFARCMLGNTLSDAVQQFLSVFSWKAVAKWLLFNVNIFSTHLWYLDAMIYVYVIHYFMECFCVSEKFIFFSSFVLLGLHLLIWHIIITSGSPLANSTFVVRNFLLNGYAFVGIGMFIRKYRQKIPQLSLFASLCFIVLGIVAIILSRYCIGNKSVPAGAIIVAVTLLCYSSQPHQLTAAPWMQNSASYSTYIYVLHPMVIVILNAVAKYLPIPTDSVAWINSMPIIVALASLLLAIILHWGILKFSRHRP